jgi:hypothetical protein
VVGREDEPKAEARADGIGDDRLNHGKGLDVVIGESDVSM